MVVESECRPATNENFGNVVVYYSPQNIGFHNSGNVILYPQPRPATDGYPSVTGHFLFAPKLGTTCSIKCFSEKKNMYNFCIVYVYYCWTVYNVRVQLFDHVKCLVVLLNASLKDDDDSKRQVKSSYCAANKLQGIFDQCSSALKKLYFVPILCQCILANGGANTRSLVRSTYALHTIKPSELCFTYPEMYEFANTKLSIVSRLLIPCWEMICTDFHVVHLHLTFLSDLFISPMFFTSLGFSSII